MKKIQYYMQMANPRDDIIVTARAGENYFSKRSVQNPAEVSVEFVPTITESEIEQMLDMVVANKDMSGWYRIDDSPKMIDNEYFVRQSKGKLTKEEEEKYERLIAYINARKYFGKFGEM